MKLDHLEAALGPSGLMIMGHVPHPDDANRTIVLIGADRGFWGLFTTSAEYHDDQPNPIDRWSKRILKPLARESIFPSDGPPYAPFIAWARATARFWQSPTGMLVHDKAGLMISIRGALIVDGLLPMFDPKGSPCDSCIDRPCVTACPIDALSGLHFYDVPACRAHISSAVGIACMNHGCATRIACPVSQSFNRPTEQTVFHMHAFRGNQ